jgi:hypothetical protein
MKTMTRTFAIAILAAFAVVSAVPVQAGCGNCPGDKAAKTSCNDKSTSGSCDKKTGWGDKSTSGSCENKADCDHKAGKEKK